MGHSIQGIVLRIGDPSPDLERLRSVVQHPLRQGLVFVPLSEALYDEIVQGNPARARNPHDAFSYMSAALAELLSEQSSNGPVAYIETDYFGGVGEQAAAVWDRQRFTVTPQKGAYGPINAALAALGASAESSYDAFEAIGLTHCRQMDVWNDDNSDSDSDNQAGAAPKSDGDGQ